MARERFRTSRRVRGAPAAKGTSRRSAPRPTERLSRANLFALFSLLSSNRERDTRRGDDRVNALHVVPAVPRVQGSAHGGGEAGHRLRRVRLGHAQRRGTLRAAGIQNQPHAQHDALVREEVSFEPCCLENVEPEASADDENEVVGRVSSPPRVPFSPRALHTTRRAWSEWATLSRVARVFSTSSRASEFRSSRRLL